MSSSVLNVNLRNCRRECRAKAFGEVHDNYNWIECASGKNPDKSYYFNVRSHCTTWTRPVPEHIDLPFFNPYTAPPQKSDEDETTPPVSDLDESLSEDKEDKEDNQANKENNAEIKFFDIASKLFYHGSRNYQKFQRRVLAGIPEEDFEGCETIPIEDFLELEYLSEDSSKRLRSSSSTSAGSNQELIKDPPKVSSSDESCQCSICLVPGDSQGASCSYESSPSYENSASCFSAPKLKPVTYSDLVTVSRKKLKRRKKRKVESPKDYKKVKRLTLDKRVYDMYGITTINYDPIFEFINPTIPTGVEPSYLTDSSTRSPVPNETTFDISLRIQDPVLSELSSGFDNTESMEISDYFKEANPETIQRPCTQSYNDILGGKKLFIKLTRIDLNKKYFKEKSTKDESAKKEEKVHSEIEGREDRVDDSMDETTNTMDESSRDEITREDYSDDDNSQDETYIPEENSTDQTTEEEYYDDQNTKDELSRDANFLEENMEESSQESAGESEKSRDYSKEKWFIVENLRPTKLSLRKIPKADSTTNFQKIEVQHESFLNEVPKRTTAENNAADSSTNFEGGKTQKESFQKKNLQNSTAENIIADSTTDFEGGNTQEKSWQKKDRKNSTVDNTTNDLSTNFERAKIQKESFQGEVLENSTADNNIDELPMDCKEEIATRVNSLKTYENSCSSSLQKCILTEVCKFSETDLSSLTPVKNYYTGFGAQSQEREKSMDVHDEQELSETETCSTVVELIRTRKGDENDERVANVQGERKLTETDIIVSDDEFQSDWTSEESKHHDSDSTYVCSESDLE